MTKPEPGLYLVCMDGEEPYEATLHYDDNGQGVMIRNVFDETAPLTITAALTSDDMRQTDIVWTHTLSLPAADVVG